MAPFILVLSSFLLFSIESYTTVRQTSHGGRRSPVETSSVSSSTSNNLDSGNQRRPIKSEYRIFQSYKNAKRNLEDMAKNIKDSLNFDPEPNYRNQAIHLLSFGRKQLQLNLTADQKKELSIAIDIAVQIITNHAFARPYKDPMRILNGVQVVIAYAAKDYGLTSPYNLIPIKTVLSGITALAGYIKAHAKENPTLSIEDRMVQNQMINEAYRLLQRLVTGTGIRVRDIIVREAEFTKVLDAVCTAGRMDIARRVMSLQDRATNAPPVSIIAYSILLRGYGDLGNLEQVERVLREAQERDIGVDTILLNSLLDAYINCGAINQANKMFRRMKRGEADAPANLRTHNTMLKGWAKLGRLDYLKRLAKEMQRSSDLWDDVTVNTIVQAAVLKLDWSFARETLDHYATETSNSTRHPQVEAYTALINGFSEAGMIAEALDMFDLMNRRNVKPTEVTFCCLLRALGRKGDLSAASDALNRMQSMNMIPPAKVYAALVLGLLDETSSVSSPEDETKRMTRIDVSVEILNRMIDKRCYPPKTLIAVVIDFMSKVRIPRPQDAIRLVDSMTQRNVCNHGDTVVWTALMKFHTTTNNITAALSAFQEIHTLDAVAVNVLLDVCAKSGNQTRVIDTFRRYFKPKGTLIPNIVTYSSILTALLSGPYSSKDFTEARKWYNAMKASGEVTVDNTFVDVVLKLILRVEVIRFLSRSDIYFIAAILNDAETLSWGPGQLERRKRVARGMLGRRLMYWFGDEYFLDSLLSPDSDALFERKGWNRVESRFHVFGLPPGPSEDRFLGDNGWNSIDSGFRLF